MTHPIRILFGFLVFVLALSACGGNNEAESAESAPEIVAEVNDDVESDIAQPDHEEAEEAMPMQMDSEDEHVEDEHVDDEHGEADEHDEGDEHAADEHADGGDMSAMHGVPAEAAAVDNPVPASAESIAAGAVLYTQSCAVCHGDEGRGDGPGGVALDPKPADLTAEHVQANSDGALFYIVSHGVEGTAMPGWDEQLSEEQRWRVVNYLRTLE
jgi:mono/diheme cytochrome c family protein